LFSGCRLHLLIISFRKHNSTIDQMTFWGLNLTLPWVLRCQAVADGKPVLDENRYILLGFWCNAVDESKGK